MQTPTSADWRRFPLHVRRTGAVVLAILGGLLLFLWLFNWSILGGPLAALASRALHRKVQIGHFSAHLLRWAPSITIEGLRIANPSWAAGPYTAQIGSITAAIEPWKLLSGHLVLSRLEIDDPQLHLQRDANRRANWDFNAAPNPPPPKPPGTLPHLPAVNFFTLRGGQMVLDDAVRHLRFQGRVVANERGSRPDLQPLRIEGQGQLNGKPFQLSFSGGALAAIQLRQPYHFDAAIVAGPLSASARGEIDRPFDLAHFGAALDLKGENLAGMYYLTGLALPFTPPFHIAGQLRTDEHQFAFRQIQATIGGSDVQGELKVDTSGVRPRLTGDLISHSMDLSDLAPSIGAGVPNEPGQADLSAPDAHRTAQGLLPTHQFQFDRLRKTDVQVLLRADAVKTAKLRIKALQLGIHVDHGVLSLDPVGLTLPEGNLSGVIRVDARGDTGVAALDLRLGVTESPLQGILLSRVQLSGRGNSVHDILGSSNGTLTAVIPHGQIRQAFDVRQGIAHSEQLVFSTDTVNVRAAAISASGPRNSICSCGANPRSSRCCACAPRS